MSPFSNPWTSCAGGIETDRIAHCGERCRNLSRSFGRKTISPTSDRAIEIVRVLSAGSKRSSAKRSSCRRSTRGRVERTRACARGVGVTPDGARMKSGSLKIVRSLRNAMLTAGWLMPSTCAARLTLSSSYRAKAIGSKLRSGFRIRSADHVRRSARE
jgi:hypothetical protein